jgi:hypothetical protein
MAYLVGSLAGVLLLGGISGYITLRVTTEPSTAQSTKIVLWLLAGGFTVMGVFATKAYLSVFALWAGIGIGWLVGTNRAKTMSFDPDAASEEADDLDRR